MSQKTPASGRVIAVALFLLAAVLGTTNLARRLEFGIEVRVERNGVTVASVNEGSDAGFAGVQVGDRIISVGGRAINTRAEARWSLEGVPSDEPQDFVIERGGTELRLSVAPDPAYGAPFIILNALIGLTFLGVGLLVWWGEARDATVRSFFRLTSLVGISILIYSHENSLNSPIAHYAYTFAWLLTYCLVTAALLDFLINFARQPEPARPSKLRFLLYLPPTLMFAALSWEYLQAYPSMNPIWVNRYEALFNTGFGALLLLYFLAGMTVLTAAYRRALPSGRIRIRWLLVCTIGGLIPFFLFYKAPVAMGLAPMMPVWAANALLLVVPIGWGMAVTSFRMMQLEWALSRTITYTIAVVAVLYLLLTIGLIASRWYFLGDTRSLMVLATLGALLLALSVTSLVGFVRRFIDRVYYSDWFNFRDAVQQIGGELARAADGGQLVTVLTRRLPELLQVTGASLVTREDGAWHCPLQESPPVESELNYIVRLLDTEYGEGVISVAAGRFSLAVPLIHTEGTVGILLIGPKLSGAPFSVRDQMLLHSLAANAATALANAALTKRLLDGEKRALAADMAGGIAHEINNALSPLMGQAQLIDYYAGHPDAADAAARDLRQPVGIIVDMSRRIKRIAQDLGRLAEPPHLERVPLSLNQVAEQAVSLLEETAGRIKRYSRTDPNAPFRLVLELSPDTPIINGDPQQLGQALINLILNACDAMEGMGRGVLTIGTSSGGVGQASPPATAIIYVADTGPGIPPELHDKVFQPYFTTKEKGRGTGLGLPLVRQIVEAHGGTLRLTCPPTGGTRFEMHLPGKPA